MTGEPDAGPAAATDRILVILHGALGDFVLALGACAAIRRHHAGARVTLLTTAPFVDLARASGYFDDVETDPRLPVWRFGAWWRLRRFLRDGGFARVYDLQTSQRTGWYFRLFDRRHRPEWSGVAKGCSHPHANPARDRMHTLDRLAEQLAAAGIGGGPGDPPLPDVSWLGADTAPFGLAADYLLMVPGGSAHRPAKRWPPGHYERLARRVAEKGVQPVLLGGPAEKGLLADIAGRCPGAVDLGGRTGFSEIAELARGARAAIGNDTGPMHLVTAAGCPSVVLFSAESDPALCAPRGPHVTVLRRPALADLSVEEAAAALGFA